MQLFSWFKTISKLGCGLILVLFLHAVTHGQAVQDKGKFKIFIFAQNVGEENYEVTKDGDVLTTKSDYKHTDRGTPVNLITTLKTKSDLTPISLETKGKTTRRSTIDTAIEIKGNTASIRENQETRQANVPDKFFTLANTLPFATQQTLYRYYLTNKIKKSLPVLPYGEISVESRGIENVKVGEKTHKLRRFLVDGLNWGKESVWLDENNNLIAAYYSVFTVAIREGFESAYSQFTKSAAANGMASLAEISKKISPQIKGALVIKNVNVIDGTGTPPLMNAVIVIENGRISAIGSESTIKLPKKAKVFDAQGKYALPGFWDMHVHYHLVENGTAYLAAGITTVRDLANDNDFILALRQSLKEGRGFGPRIFAAGLIDGDSPFSLGMVRANTPEQAREAVNLYYNAGFEQIKIYSSIKPAILKVICDEAKRLGLTVTGHVPIGDGTNPADRLTTEAAVIAGMDQINHAQPFLLPTKPFDFRKGSIPEWEREKFETWLKLFKEKNISFDPTLANAEFSFHPKRIPLSEFEPGVNKTPELVKRELNNSGVLPDREKDSEIFFDFLLQTVGILHKNGVTIVAGTDGIVPGHSLKRVLELYVKAGFTPMEAIQSATIVPARVMKKDKDLGSLEAGKIADIVLIEGNPLENISNTRNAKFVITNGIMYDSATLWQSIGFKP
jgi:hypothetical protein